MTRKFNHYIGFANSIQSWDGSSILKLGYKLALLPNEILAVQIVGKLVSYTGVLYNDTNRALARVNKIMSAEFI